MRIDDKYKWLARDEDGGLWAFEEKPYKSEDTEVWGASLIKCVEFFETDNSFSFVNWNDEEPTLIHDIQVKLPQTDVVNKPLHYIGINGLEMEEVLENFLPRFSDGYVAHRIGSATEYLLRSPLKNQLEDIKKAKRNLEQVIAYEEGKSKPIEFKGNRNDPLVEFLTCLIGIGIPEVSDINKVKSYYAGNNFND